MIDSPVTRSADRLDASQLSIMRGTCYAIYAFDVAGSIDLDLAQKRIEPTERQTVQQKRRAPEYFEYRPAPLRVTWAAPTIAVGGHTTAPVVDLVMYDFGAISISFSISIPGALAGLIDLASALRGNEALRSAARRLLDQMMDMLGQAAERPRVASFVEDYLIFQLDEWSPGLDAGALHDRLAPAI